MMGPKLFLVLSKSTLFNLKLKYYKLLGSEVINTVYKMCVMINELTSSSPGSSFLVHLDLFIFIPALDKYWKFLKCGFLLSTGLLLQAEL